MKASYFIFNQEKGVCFENTSTHGNSVAVGSKHAWRDRFQTLMFRTSHENMEDKMTLSSAEAKKKQKDDDETGSFKKIEKSSVIICMLKKKAEKEQPTKL